MNASLSPALSPFRRGESIIAALCVLAVALTAMNGAWFEWNRGGDLWRVVTCHFTHWTYEQLAWDALAFAALGIACARRNLRAFHATLLASIVLIPLAVSAFAPRVSAYRGLSGIDSALFALLLVQARRSPLAIACAIGFVAKIAFEATTGGAVFATNMGTDVIAVPVAHVAGAVIGALTGTIDGTAGGAGWRSHRHVRLAEALLPRTLPADSAAEIAPQPTGAPMAGPTSAAGPAGYTAHSCASSSPCSSH